MLATATLYVDPVVHFPFLAEHPEYGSAAKLDNLERLIEARNAGQLTLDACPAFIRLEPSAHCNLRCCWAQRQPKHPALRPRGHAEPDLARRIVDQIGDRLYQVILCHWGEPLLNSRLPELVRIFHEAGIYTTFDTNMTLMTPELAEALVKAGLDRVSASIDGLTQESYAQYRRGGRVEKALDGLRYMVQARRRLGRKNPVIRWQYLVFEHNQHEVAAARELAGEIGVDTFDAFGGSGRSWSSEAGFAPPQTPRRPDGLLCTDPWMYLAVDWDGGVHLCCRAFQARHVVGHMEDDDLESIFNNDGFQLARRVIRDGVWSPEDRTTPCTGCNFVKLHVPAIAALGHRLTVD